MGLHRLIVDGSGNLGISEVAQVPTQNAPHFRTQRNLRTPSTLPVAPAYPQKTRRPETSSQGVPGVLEMVAQSQVASKVVKPIAVDMVHQATIARSQSEERSVHEERSGSVRQDKLADGVNGLTLGVCGPLPLPQPTEVGVVHNGNVPLAQEEFLHRSEKCKQRRGNGQERFL